jgi:periplasmic protein CpxP/Spy
MNKSTLGWYVAGFLAVINLALVAFWIVLPRINHVAPGDRPRKAVIERLKLTNTQVQAYDVLIADHRAKVRAGNNQILASKTALYTQLKSETTNQTLIDSLTNQIALDHSAIERIHYQHFRQIKAICEPHQLPLFDALVLDLAQIFNKKPAKQ